jgi:ATP-binding cassette subfamily D (ALD) long-chain fatty acid import protein
MVALMATAKVGRALWLTRSIVSSMVTGRWKLFLMNIARFCAIAIPATYTNSMIVYLQNELALAYRTR